MSDTECPKHLLPEGVSSASFDPVVLRACADLFNASPVHPEICTKPWIVLHLLELAGFSTAPMVEAREDWVYVGCPTCGTIATIPRESTMPPPWCMHDGTKVSYRRDSREWTRMLPVRVEVVTS